MWWGESLASEVTHGVEEKRRLSEEPPGQPHMRSRPCSLGHQRPYIHEVTEQEGVRGFLKAAAEVWGLQYKSEKPSAGAAKEECSQVWDLVPIQSFLTQRQKWKTRWGQGRTSSLWFCLEKHSPG